MAALDPNRAAQPEEADILNKLLDGVDTELEMLESRLKRAQSLSYGARQSLFAAQEAVNSADTMTAHIKNQMSATKEQVEIARGLLHPVRRLPVEVVREIHLQWLHIPDARADMVPFHAARVCRAWRRIALETPALWSRPTIRLDLIREARYPFNKCMSAWQERVKVHLSSAPERSLAVALVGHRMSTPRWIFGLVMQLLASANELSIVDCASLDTDDAVYRILTSIAVDVVKVKLTGKLPKTFEMGEMTMNAVNLLPCCARLYSLALENWDMNWSSQRSFDTLMVLDIIDSDLHLDQISLAALAASMPVLSTLTLRIRTIREHDEYAATPSTRIAFDRVESINIIAAIDHEVPTWLRFPVARDVTIDWVGDGSLESVFRPSLGEILRMFRAVDGSEVARCLSTLDMPTADFDHGAAIALRTAPELKELRVTHDCWHEEEIQFWAALSSSVGGVDNPDDSSWIVPKLLRLRVRELCHSYDDNDDERLGANIESILGMVKARSAAANEDGGPAKLLNIQLDTELPKGMMREAIIRAME